MKKKQTHMAYGIIAGIGMVIIGLILYLTNMSFVRGMSYVSYIPLLICIILNANAYSKANDGYVTFGNVFGSGFKTSLVCSAIMVVWAIIMHFHFPGDER